MAESLKLGTPAVDQEMRKTILPPAGRASSGRGYSPWTLGGSEMASRARGSAAHRSSQTASARPGRAKPALNQLLELLAVGVVATGVSALIVAFLPHRFLPVRCGRLTAPL